MRTRREFGQLIFGGSSNIPTAQRYGVHGGGNASCQRGTTTKDSWEPSPGKYRTEILIDGNDTPGEYNCDMPIASGTRVVVLMFSTQGVILPISSLILDAASQDAAAQDADVRQDLSNEITKRGEEIKAGAVQDSKLYTDQTVNSLSTTIADTYQSKSDMASYATTSQLEQTSEDITSTFTASLNEKGKTYIGQPSPPYNVGDVWIKPETGMSYTCTTARETGSYSSSDWTKHDAFVSSIIRQDVDGITVGNSMTDYEARVSASGRFQILYKSKDLLDIFGNGGNVFIANAWQGSSGTELVLQSYNGNSHVRVGDQRVYFTSPTGTFQTPYPSIGDYALFGNVTRLLGGIVLYNNSSGNSGTVTTDYNITSYAMLEIVFLDGGGRQNTVRVHDPKSGRTCTMSRVVYGGSTVYVTTDVLSITSKGITRSSSNRGVANISNEGNYVSTSTELKITQIIGWG